PDGYGISGVGNSERCIRIQLDGVCPRRHLDDERLVPGNGLSAMRALDHALVLAKTTSDEDVDLEYLASDWWRRDFDSVRLSRRLWLANLLLRACGDRAGVRWFPLVQASRHAAERRPAGSRRHASRIAGTGVKGKLPRVCDRACLQEQIHLDRLDR